MCPQTYTHVCAHTDTGAHTNASSISTKDKNGDYIKTKSISKRLIHLRSLCTNHFVLSFYGGLQKTFMHGDKVDS